MGLLDKFRGEPTAAEIKRFNRTGRGSGRVAEAHAKHGGKPPKSPFKQAKEQARAQKTGRK